MSEQGEDDAAQKAAEEAEQQAAEDEEFGDYFDECQQIEDGEIQNQAAGLETGVEPRQKVEGEGLDEPEKKLIG